MKRGGHVTDAFVELRSHARHHIAPSLAARQKTGRPLCCQCVSPCPPASSLTDPANKRKRPAPDDDDLTDLSDTDRDDEPEFAPAKPKKRAAQPRKPKPTQPAKKPRTTTAPAKPKPRRTKPKQLNGAFDATKLAADTKIAADNPLFSASPPLRPRFFPQLARQTPYSIPPPPSNPPPRTFCTRSLKRPTQPRQN